MNNTEYEKRQPVSMRQVKGKNKKRNTVFGIIGIIIIGIVLVVTIIHILIVAGVIVGAVKGGQNDVEKPPPI